MNPPPERLALEEASTTDLLREVLDETKELVRIEIEIAKSEVQEEIAQGKRAAIGFAIAFACLTTVGCLLSVALVLALGGTAVVALALAAAFLVIGAIGGFAGYKAVPKKPLARTRARLEGDVHELKEHLA